MKNRFTVDEYFLIKDKSIEEKRRALTKIEKKQKNIQYKEFLYEFYEKVYEDVMKISDKREKDNMHL